MCELMARLRAAGRAAALIRGASSRTSYGRLPVGFGRYPGSGLPLNDNFPAWLSRIDPRAARAVWGLMDPRARRLWIEAQARRLVEFPRQAVAPKEWSVPDPWRFLDDPLGGLSRFLPTPRQQVLGSYVPSSGWTLYECPPLTTAALIAPAARFHISAFAPGSCGSPFPDFGFYTSFPHELADQAGEFTVLDVYAPPGYIQARWSYIRSSPNAVPAKWPWPVLLPAVAPAPALVPRLEPVPYRGVSLEPRVPRMPRLASQYAHRVPPPRGTKEVKPLGFGPGARKLAGLLNALTEAQDVIDPLWKSLPTATRRSCMGELPAGASVNLAEKAFCVVRNADKINWGKAIPALVWNYYEDKAIGRANARARNFFGRSPSGISRGFGPAF